MSWELLTCLAVLYQYGVIHTAEKKICAIQGSRTRKLVWQYFFAASLALITATIAGQLELTWPVMIVAIIGAANAFGCYCHWRAYDISMSRTAMLSNLDDFLAIGLGYALLGELDILTPILATGVVVSIVSAIAFAMVKRLDKTKSGLSGRLIGWIFGYSFIWGVAMFSLRFFAVQGLNILTFMVAWYVGAWLGALLTRFMIMGRDESGSPLTHSQQAKMFLMAIFIWTSLMFGYKLRELAPITVIQPIQLVAEMSIPTIIALIFFGEARNISRKEVIVIAGGLMGVALIAIGF